jgi:hypothetical protein
MEEKTALPTSNEQAVKLNTEISGAVKIAESAADLAIEAQVDLAFPLLTLPVVKQISDAFIQEFVSLIGKQLSIGLQQIGTFIVIDTQVDNEKVGVSQGLANLMIAEKKGNKDEINQAIQAFASAQSALVHDDGSAPPVK